MFLGRRWWSCLAGSTICGERCSLFGDGLSFLSVVVNVVNRRGSTTILGIDPGTATMGWGVIRQEGNRLRYVQHGTVTTPASWEMPRRLGRLFDGVTELIEGYRPVTVAVEELFFNTNVTTAITVGQARGVALLAAYRAGV